MDYGRCPRCKGALNQLAKPFARRECMSCGMTIIDNSAESYKIKDDKGKQSVNFGIYGIPETILVNNDLKILKKYVGPLSSKDVKEIQKIVKK